MMAETIPLTHNNPVFITDVMTRLREETKELHDVTEAVSFSKALMSETLPLSVYVAQLEAYLPVYRTLEKQCKGHSHPMVQAVWQADMVKTPWLLEDLGYFSLEAGIPSAALQRAIAGFMHHIEREGQEQPLLLLGTMYVLEGATLGAKVLLPHIQKAFDLQDKGTRFYHAYGDQTEQHWRNFKARMNRAVTTPNEQDEVVEGGKQTFKKIQAILNALWTYRA